MKIVIALCLFAMLQLTSSAPSDMEQYEQSILNKLHKPWYIPDKPPEYPRKGEYPCKGGICKIKASGCEDCQYAKPLKF